MPDDRGQSPSGQTAFEEVLALSLDRMQAGESPDQTLTRFPELAAELRPSLSTAHALQEYFAQEAGPLQPASTPLLARLRDGIASRLAPMAFDWRSQSSLWRAHCYLSWFIARANYQTGALYPDAYRRGWAKVEAALDESPRARRTRRGLARWRTVGAFALLLLLFAAALWSQPDVLASAMPGQAFYPMKRALEQTGLFFARDAATRAQLHLNLAQRRLDESRYLLQQQRPLTAEQVDEVKVETLAAFSEASHADPRAKPMLLAQLLDLTHQVEQFYNPLLTQVEPKLQQELRQVIVTVQNVSAQVQQQINNVGLPPSVPPLNATVAAPVLLPGETPINAPPSIDSGQSTATNPPSPSATPEPLLPTLLPTSLPTVIVPSPPAPIAVPSLPVSTQAKLTVPPLPQPTVPVHLPTLPVPTLPLP